MEQDIKTLSAAAKLLNECSRRSELGFKIDAKALSNEVGISEIIFDIAVEQGFFEPKGGGLFTSTMPSFQPKTVKDIFIIHGIVEKILAKREVNLDAKSNEAEHKITPTSEVISHAFVPHQLTISGEDINDNKTCIKCGNSFFSDHWNALYCSLDCKSLQRKQGGKTEEEITVLCDEILSGLPVKFSRREAVSHNNKIKYSKVDASLRILTNNGKLKKVSAGIYKKI